MSLTRLAELDPCADWAPVEQRADHLDELVARLCASQEPLPDRATVTRRERRWSIRAAAIGAAALTVAGVAAVVSSSGDGVLRTTDARAALISAVTRTTAFTSGHVTWTETRDGSTTDYALTTTNDVRYQGSSIATDYRSTWTRNPPAGATDSTGGFRFVGDRAWAREGDGPWREFRKPDGPPAQGAIGRESLAGQLDAARSLTTAVRTAPEVTSQTADGTTTYQATLANDQLPEAFGAFVTDATSTTRLSVTVGDDGVAHRFTLEGKGHTVDATFSDLGAVQQITAP